MESLTVSYCCVVALLLSYCSILTTGEVPEGNGQDKHTLYFLSMLPYPDPRPSFQSLYEDGPDIVPSAYLAIQQISNRSDILRDYHIELIESDGGCNIATKALEAFVVSVFHSGKQVVGVIGPGCSDSAIAVSSFCSRSEIALVTIHIANSPQLASRTLFPYAFAVTDTSFDKLQSITALIKHNSWRHVAVVYDASAVVFFHMARRLIEKVNDLPDYNSAIFAAPVDGAITLLFDDIRDSLVRIIIALVQGQSLCKLLCLAHHKQLVFPAYQWVIIDPETHNFCNTSVSGVETNGRFSCTTDEMISTLSWSILITTDIYPLDSPHTVFILTDEELQMEWQLAENVQGSQLVYNQFYDGVWSLALALNRSIEVLAQKNTNLSDYHYGNEDITHIIQQEFYQLDFRGASGQVKFDPSTGSRNPSSISLQQYTDDINQPPCVGSYRQSEWNILDNATFIPGEFPFVFSHVPYIEAVLVLLLTMVTGMSVALTHILTVIYRRDGAVMASSPTLNHFIYIGTYVILLAVVTYTLTRTLQNKYEMDVALCNFSVWFVNVGLTLILSTVCAKTWRLYDVFVISSVRLSKGTRWTNRVLSFCILILTLIDATMCAIWSAVDPVVQHTTQTLQTEYQHVKTENTCRSKHGLGTIIIPLLLLYKLILLTWSAILAFLTRRIRMKHFKTENVTRLVYLLCLVSGLGIPAFFITEQLNQITAVYVIFCTLLNLLAVLCLACLLLPPLLPKLRHKCSICHTHIPHGQCNHT